MKPAGEFPDSWIYALRDEMRRVERPTDAQRQIMADCTMAIDGNDAERREATERLQGATNAATAG